MIVKTGGPKLVKRLHGMDGFFGKFGLGQHFLYGVTFSMYAKVKFVPSNTWSGIGSCRKFKVSR